ELIARAAAGGMRDALSLLDQAIAYAGSDIALAHVQSMLGVADPRAISTFITSIAEFDGSAVLHLINDLSEAGADLRQVNAQIIEYWRALMLTRAGANAAEILDLIEDEMKGIKLLAERFILEELTECARIFAQNELTQKNQGTPQLGLELAALDCIEVHRRAQAGQPVRAVAAPVAPVPARPQEQRVALPQQATPERDAPMRAAPAAQNGRSPAQRIDRPAQETIAPEPPRQAVSSAPTGGESSGESGRPTLTVLQVARAWENVRKRAKQKSAMLAAYLAYIEVVGIEGTAEQPVVVIRATKATHLKYVKDENRYKELEWALQVEFNLPSCQVRLLSPDQSPTIAEAPRIYSTSVSPLAAPQDSAFREPPMTIEPAEPTMSAPQSTHDGEQDSDASSSLNSYAADAGGLSPGTGLARKHVIRENRQEALSASHESREAKETLEQKARHDPVVQEVMRTFKANIVDIHPK
ncbi:MAG TPA: hypothetical protein VGT44_18205, partial [Ktedonobacteraceae bacterium]|nr:hypothetical protein [Ktedonobacteraceae bacterium]